MLLLIYPQALLDLLVPLARRDRKDNKVSLERPVPKERLVRRVRQVQLDQQGQLDHQVTTNVCCQRAVK